MLLISVAQFQVSSDQKVPDQGWVDMGQKSPMEDSVKVKASLTSWVIWQIWQEADGPFVLPVSFQFSPSHFSALKHSASSSHGKHPAPDRPIGTPWARLTKQGKLVWDRNPIKAQMGVESSEGELLTMRKFKNTYADSAFSRLGRPCFKYYLLFCCHRSTTFVISLLFLG